MAMMNAQTNNGAPQPQGGQPPQGIQQVQGGPSSFQGDNFQQQLDMTEKAYENNPKGLAKLASMPGELVALMIKHKGIQDYLAAARNDILGQVEITPTIDRQADQQIAQLDRKPATPGAPGSMEQMVAGNNQLDARKRMAMQGGGRGPAMRGGIGGIPANNMKSLATGAQGGLVSFAGNKGSLVGGQLSDDELIDLQKVIGDSIVAGNPNVAALNRLKADPRMKGNLPKSMQMALEEGSRQQLRTIPEEGYGRHTNPRTNRTAGVDTAPGTGGIRGTAPKGRPGTVGVHLSPSVQKVADDTSKSKFDVLKELGMNTARKAAAPFAAYGTGVERIMEGLYLSPDERAAFARTRAGIGPAYQSNANQSNAKPEGIAAVAPKPPRSNPDWQVDRLSMPPMMKPGAGQGSAKPAEPSLLEKGRNIINSGGAGTSFTPDPAFAALMENQQKIDAEYIKAIREDTRAKNDLLFEESQRIADLKPSEEDAAWERLAAWAAAVGSQARYGSGMIAGSLASSRESKAQKAAEEARQKQMHQNDIAEADNTAAMNAKIYGAKAKETILAKDILKMTQEAKNHADLMKVEGKKMELALLQLESTEAGRKISRQIQQDNLKLQTLLAQNATVANKDKLVIDIMKVWADENKKIDAALALAADDAVKAGLEKRRGALKTTLGNMVFNIRMMIDPNPSVYDKKKK